MILSRLVFASSKARSALCVGSTSHRVRCIGFQYQNFDVKLSDAMTEAFNKPRTSRSVAPSPPPEKKRVEGKRSDRDGTSNPSGEQRTQKKRKMNDIEPEAQLGNVDVASGASAGPAASQGTAPPVSHSAVAAAHASAPLTSSRPQAPLPMTSEGEADHPRTKPTYERSAKLEGLANELDGAPLPPYLATKAHQTGSIHDHGSALTSKVRRA